MAPRNLRLGHRHSLNDAGQVEGPPHKIDRRVCLHRLPLTFTNQRVMDVRVPLLLMFFAVFLFPIFKLAQGHNLEVFVPSSGPGVN